MGDGMWVVQALARFYFPMSSVTRLNRNYEAQSIIFVAREGECDVVTDCVSQQMMVRNNKDRCEYR